MSFQMPPAIRPFDPNHWLCGSSPLPRSDSWSGYRPVNEGPELNRKPTHRAAGFFRSPFGTGILFKKNAKGD
eukprot:jgi/Astpho2/9035/Aster-02697